MKSDEMIFNVVLMALIGLVAILVVLLSRMGKAIYRWMRSSRDKNKAPASQPNQRFQRPSGPADEWSDQINSAWSRGDYDLARARLQKIAYTMANPSTTAEEKRRFTQLMTEFAKDDPLYKDVMERVVPLVRANPGMLQSNIYKGQPEHVKEQVRYVLYFANELGHIKRSKKGNSYQLTLPDDVCTESTLIDVTNLENLGRVSQYVANHPRHTNDAMWFYKTAYYHVMKSIVADVKQIDAMLPDLMSTFEQGNKRRVRQIFNRYLPDGAWNWPAYEKQLVEWKKSIPAYIPDEGSEDDEIDYDDMIDKLCARIDMTAYAIRRKDELKDSIKERGGKWMFVTLDNIFTPSDCKKRNGMLFDHDDPILDNFPPCENIMCGCRLTLAR